MKVFQRRKRCPERKYIDEQQQEDRIILQGLRNFSSRMLRHQLLKLRPLHCSWIYPHVVRSEIAHAVEPKAPRMVGHGLLVSHASEVWPKLLAYLPQPRAHKPHEKAFANEARACEAPATV